MVALYQLIHSLIYILYFFFFNDTATTEIYTLSLHDALPISVRSETPSPYPGTPMRRRARPARRVKSRHTKFQPNQDRKSTRLNSSHSQISYAVFCLKKKKKDQKHHRSALL